MNKEDKKACEMSDRVVALHAAFCLATGTQLALNQCSERWWYDAAKEGMTPTHVVQVIAERKRGIRAGERNQACLLLRNICGNEEAICNVLNEAALIKANERKPKVDPARRSVLRATGRDEDFAQGKVRSVDEVIKAMREAANRKEIE